MKDRKDQIFNIFEADLGDNRDLYLHTNVRRQSVLGRDKFDIWYKTVWCDEQTKKRGYYGKYSYNELLLKDKFDKFNDDKFEWCENNCVGLWGYNLSNRFFFEKEQDSIHFTLTWL